MVAFLCECGGGHQNDPEAGGYCCAAQYSKKQGVHQSLKDEALAQYHAGPLAGAAGVGAD